MKENNDDKPNNIDNTEQEEQNFFDKEEFKNHISKAVDDLLTNIVDEKINSKEKLIPIDQNLPKNIALIPVQLRPLFPGIFTPITLSAPEDIKAAQTSYNDEGYIGIVLMKNDVDVPTTDDLYTVGTLAKIVKKINLPDGGMNIFISTIKRFKIKKIYSSRHPYLVSTQYLEDVETDTFEVKALARVLISEMKGLSDNNPFFTEEMRLNMINIDNPGKIADFITSILPIEKSVQQKILEITNVRKRIEQVLLLIKKEQDVLKVQKQIQKRLSNSMEENQRDYYLREELKSIQKELGINEDKTYEKLKKLIDEFNFEGEVKETVYEELNKFQNMDQSSPEYSTSRNFLELVTKLPWNEKSEENFDITTAKKILERDHFGLEDVKKRIIEFLSVKKIKKDGKGSILILVGPPGVGKTSIGRSIANSMNKPFYRFSVGGLNDEAEIKGHRRTYIGSMCGKIIQGIKLTHSKSSVFLIDEVDKMTSNIKGDPASALLEVLDPEQNKTFRDNYLDMPFDLSNIFFILTANSLDTIPEPLLDRAEIISISGYIDQEKIEIARKYLIPKNLEKNGLKKNQIKYTKEVLLKIAEEYARESGVRNFEKCIDKINRKIITEKTTEAEEKFQNEQKEFNLKIKDLTEEEKISQNLKEPKFDDYFDKDFQKELELSELEKYLGKPVFDESEILKADVPGTAIGLAWTSMGGDTLLLESVTFPGKEDLVLTGQMGDVMKESAEIAFNVAKKIAFENKIKKPEWFEKNTVHLHIPEGATPKDGPSAGITMATTFLSLFCGKTIKKDLAMTGELSLTGKVLPIGGLREKTVAAKRNKIKTIIIPNANKRDLEKIPEHVKKGINFIPVSRIEQVIQEVLPSLFN